MVHFSAPGCHVFATLLSPLPRAYRFDTNEAVYADSEPAARLGRNCSSSALRGPDPYEAHRRRSSVLAC